MRSQQIGEREENGVKVRIMAPDPRTSKDTADPPRIASRDDSRSPWQKYRRRELERW